MDDRRIGSLEHPLPGGMHDLLPEEAARRQFFARALLDRFALWGYALVTPPAFEFAEVLERGLGTLDPADVLRFVEPESGEVAALRPDMTPQVARMIATRLRNRHAPLRIAYEGTVLRRRSGRARKHRQIAQVGVELAGRARAGVEPAASAGFSETLEGDLEVLSLAVAALRETGLARFTVDLGEAAIVRSLLDGASDSVVARATEALAVRDDDALRAAGLDVLADLARLGSGSREALVEARARLVNPNAIAAVDRLLALYDAVRARLPPEIDVTVDPGEVRGFAYYTGLIFHVYAPGPGLAIAAGGRYDELLARFGAPMPAVGFAIDLDALAWAERAQGRVAPAPRKVVVVGPPDAPELERLRAGGTAAVSAPDRATALAYARDWGFTAVVDGADEIPIC